MLNAVVPERRGSVGGMVHSCASRAYAYTRTRDRYYYYYYLYRCAVVCVVGCVVGCVVVCRSAFYLSAFRCVVRCVVGCVVGCAAIRQVSAARVASPVRKPKTGLDTSHPSLGHRFRGQRWKLVGAVRRRQGGS